jgi:hypothetical protein
MEDAVPVYEHVYSPGSAVGLYKLNAVLPIA